MGEQQLAGRTALVTGASQGIGKASARALAEDGAAVVITGRREDALKAALDELRAEVLAAQIEMLAGDATSEADVKAALALAHGLLGRLDIIVSVVGEPTFKPLLLRDLDQVRHELDTNFISAFLAVRHGVPLMRKGGTIICMSSAAATQAGWGLTVYAAAKAAVERFVRAAAFEIGGAGIRINAVRPGLTLPLKRQQDPSLAAMIAVYEAETPMGRVGLPEDVASVVRFLARDESGWVTGQTFSADGGLDQGKGPDPMDSIYGKELMDQVRAGRPPEE
jgi:NAD(P)-dependent dehydrogenase (short-subunit alcohol dehydrogenase family)